MKRTGQGVSGAHGHRVMARSPDAEESCLLKAIGRGDRAAFAAFYRRYYPRLYRFLGVHIRQSGTIEEVVNDTLFVVWTKAAEFRGDSRVSTWVFGIGYRTALKALEAERRYKAEPEESLPEFANPVCENEQLHLNRWLRMGLDRLSVEQQLVVELTFVFGYSYAEIAQIMQCPENTVKTRMFHARKQLQKILPELANDAREQTKIS